MICICVLESFSFCDFVLCKLFLSFMFAIVHTYIHTYIHSLHILFDKAGFQQVAAESVDKMQTRTGGLVDWRTHGLADADSLIAK